MEARITYRSEVYIKGNSLEEIKEKWESINLDNVENEKDVTDYGFIDVISIEDANSYEDLMPKFDSLYDR